MQGVSIFAFRHLAMDKACARHRRLHVAIILAVLRVTVATTRIPHASKRDGYSQADKIRQQTWSQLKKR